MLPGWQGHSLYCSFSGVMHLHTFRERGEPVPPDMSLEVARRIKERYCYIASDIAKVPQELLGSKCCVASPLLADSNSSLLLPAGSEASCGPACRHMALESKTD